MLGKMMDIFDFGKISNGYFNFSWRMIAVFFPLATKTFFQQKCNPKFELMVFFCHLFLLFFFIKKNQPKTSITCHTSIISCVGFDNP